MKYEVVVTAEVPFTDSPKRFIGMPAHLWKKFGFYERQGCGTGDGYLEHRWCATLEEAELDELVGDYSYAEVEENMGMLMGNGVGLIPSVIATAEPIYGSLQFTVSGYPDGIDLKTHPFTEWPETREAIRRKCLGDYYTPTRGGFWEFAHDHQEATP